jgi:DNA invertase Pin-like site-specific DNA recombinase
VAVNCSETILRSVVVRRAVGRLLSPGIPLWTHVCLYDTMWAYETDGAIPEGTAVGEASEVIGEHWCTRRGIDSPRHRCVLVFEEEGTEMKKRAVLYCRISTGDQHLETQLLDLREMAKQRGYEIVQEYTDIISRSKARRPGLDQLVEDARRHRFDIVLVAAFDRVARSVRHFLEVLDELSHVNIEFISLRENIDTGGALGRAMVVIVGTIAELEKSLIVERVRAGMRRAELEGSRIGRAPLNIDRQQVVAGRRSGMSLTEVAKKHRVSRATVCRLTNAARGLKSHAGNEEKAVPLTETGNWQAAA